MKRLTQFRGNDMPERLLPIALFILLGVPPHASGAGRIPLTLEMDVPEVEYRESVPLPESVLGHRIGERHTRPDQAVAYFDAVAAAVDRVVVRRHGETYEGRPLVHAIVTSPENHRRLEEIRRANLRLSDEPDAVPDRELADLPVVVLMGYGVHGNEASGTEAALLLLYHLAAGEGPPVDRVLAECVVLIDPMLNPDGRSRFVEWVNANRGEVAVADPAHREHNEPWPGGRSNRYWFDMNRDWLPVQLRESRARLELFHDWRPQLVTDFHEMGSDTTYFFQPGVPSRNNPNTPERTYELTREIAQYHAKHLDRIGSLYFSEESFDDFYFGKGSTYPDINGAVGILFEQASSRGLLRETSTGVLAYDFTIRNQFATSLSSLEAAVALRPSLMAHHRDFYREALREAEAGTVGAYVIDARRDGARGVPFVETLIRHRIRVHRLGRDLNAGERRFKAGEAFIVPTRQPQARLLRTLMEEVTDFNDSVFYDVSTWTLPLAFAIHVEDFVGDPNRYLGPPLTEIPSPSGGVQGGTAEYAYLMPWDHVSAPRALFALQEAGLHPRLMLAPFAIPVAGAPQSFDLSTVVLPLTGAGVEPPAIHELVRRLADESGVSFYAVSTGRTADGPDLGGPSSRVLPQPRVALLSGPGTRSSHVGEIWHLLNERMAIPVTLLDVNRLRRTDLGRYNTIVVPGGAYEDVGDAEVTRLAGWVRAGGLLIAIQSGARWLVDKEFIDERLREWTAAVGDPPYEEVERARRSLAIPGSIFETRLDSTHPLAFGLGERLPVFRDHELLFELSQSPGANVARYGPSPLLSGYIASERLPQLAGTAAVIARRMGSGRVVLFADNPTYRGFWYGTSTMFLNALFFGHAF
jgi:hypothetical protein